jgi:hypothetical protein
LILPKRHCAGTRGKTRTRNLLIRVGSVWPRCHLTDDFDVAKGAR